MTKNLIRIRASAETFHGWALVLTDVKTGRILPVSTEDKIEIVYQGSDKPLKIHCTLLASEIDIEAMSHSVDVVLGDTGEVVKATLSTIKLGEI